MKQTLETKIGDYQINYSLETERGAYYITVEEKENFKTAIRKRFCTTIKNEKEAIETLNLLWENQVGIVHIEDILNEFGYTIE